MNQVSWRRILQRAGSDFPGDDAAAVIHLQDRAPPPRSPVRASGMQASGSGDLESELKRALDRAARQQREPRPAGPPPGWDPKFIASQPTGRALATVQSRAKPQAVPRSPYPAKRAASGARNVLAISLSVAVIGVAFHQIGTQWTLSRDSDQQLPREINTATVLHAGTAQSDGEAQRLPMPGEDLQAQPGLRPSFAPEAATSASAQADNDRETLFQEMEQAARLFLAKQAQKNEIGVAAGAVPSKPHVEPIAAAPTIPSGDEQAMLMRGRELMERGHVSGARLIFEHLESQQSALGAFALAQTYDATVLSSLPVAGIEPDQKLAEQWYQRAAQLGNPNAQGR